MDKERTLPLFQALQGVFFYIGFLPLLSAQILVQDDFSYPNGNLVGNGGWTQHGAGTAVAVSGGNVLISNTGQDVNESIASSTISSGSLYYGMSLQVTAVQTGDLFAALLNTSNSSGARMYAKSDGSGGFYFGVSRSSSVSYGTSSLTLGTTYNVVVRYDFVAGTANDVATLYVNPTNLLTEGSNTAYATLNSGGSVDLSDAKSFAFIQNVSTSAPSVTVHELRVGTDFTSAATAIPEPSCLGIGFGPDRLDSF